MRKIIARQAGPVVTAGMPAYFEETDEALAQQSMGPGLKMIEVLLKSDPDNRDLLLDAAQGFCGDAYLFLEDTEPERAKLLYGRGEAYGRRLLDSSGRPSKNDAPAAFWTAQCWLGRINLSKDDPEAVAEAPKAVALAQRAQELDPGYWYGGPDALLGAYYASRPKMLGGDLAKSKAHFDAALARRPDFLINKVLFAQYYAVAAQDKALFKSVLEEVEAARPDFPEQALANTVARRKAKRLLEEIDELF